MKQKNINNDNPNSVKIGKQTLQNYSYRFVNQLCQTYLFPRATISLFRERTYTIQPHLETKRKIETVECKENQTRKQVTRTNNDSDQKAGESDRQKPKINAIFSHRL